MSVYHTSVKHLPKNINFNNIFSKSKISTKKLTEPETKSSSSELILNYTERIQFKTYHGVYSNKSQYFIFIKNNYTSP